MAPLLAALALASGGASLDEGLRLHREGRPLEALRALQRAARERPRDARVLWAMGLAYLALDNAPGALAAIDAARALDPACTFAGRERFEEVRQLARSRFFPDAPPLPPDGGSALGDPFLEQVVRNLARDPGGVHDYTGLLSAADVAGLRARAAELEASGHRLRLAFLGAEWAPRLQRFVQVAFRQLGGGPRDVLVAATPLWAAAKTRAIADYDMARIVMRHHETFVASYARGLLAIAADVARLVRRKAERAGLRTRGLVWVVSGVGGVLLVFALEGWVRGVRRRRSARP